MPDFTRPPCSTLLVGMTGSDKTTFAIRYLLNAPDVACRFIFDDENRTAPRLKLAPAYTAAQLEAALASRWVCFSPHRMFPGNVKMGFRWFCHWVFNCAQRGPGEKIVNLPEVWKFCTADSIPFELAKLSQEGRELGVQLLIDTQRPENVNPSLIGGATELVAFKLISPEAVRAVSRLAADPAAVSALPLGSFLAYNRLSGGSLAGRVF